MPKFNQPIPPRTTDARTAQGGEGFSRSPKDELFLLGVANMVGESTFYESGTDRDDRFEKLVHEVTKADEKWMTNFIGWLRSEANMRSAPIVAAAEYIRAGGSGGRQVVTSVLRRPDEPGELLGYWLNRYGRKLPQPIKRGIADALPRLYNERNTLKYDGSGNTIRFGDVVELVHPQGDSHQSVLYKHLIDRRHGRGELIYAQLATLVKDTELTHLANDQRRDRLADAIECGWSWERLGGWLPGGMDAAAWEAVIPNMGLMALTRNLRNFDEAGISATAVAAVSARFLDAEEVKRSRQFPLRFLTAWKALSSMRWGMALEGALNLSLANVPELPGRTLVLVDVSGSMATDALSRRMDIRADKAVRPHRWEVAATFAGSLAQRAKAADIALFTTAPVAQARIGRAESILRFVEQCRQYVGGGTDIMGSLVASYDNHDRVVILTDEQTGAGGSEYMSRIHCPVYVFNLAGYKVGVTPNQGRWHTFGGLNDACFRLIPLLEGRHNGIWPWEVTEPASVAAASSEDD